MIQFGFTLFKNHDSEKIDCSVNSMDTKIRAELSLIMLVLTFIFNIFYYNYVVDNIESILSSHTI